MAETTTKRATAQWQVRLICCGRDDGIVDVATRGEAEVLRSQYTAAEGHDRAAIIHGPADRQEHDPAAILAEYLAALRADNGMRSIVGDCIALLNALRDDRAQLRRQLEAAEAQPCGHDIEALTTDRNRLGELASRAAANVQPLRALVWNAQMDATSRSELADILDELDQIRDAVIAHARPGPLESAVTEALDDTATQDAAVVRHVQPGIEGDAPEHPGLFADCEHPVCVTSRRQHAAADRIQDITAELFAEPAPATPPWLVEAGDD